jgi:hypothetical protein
MSELEQPHNPEDIAQQTEQSFDVTSLKKIDMSREDYDLYAELDPDDPRVAELLSQYNIAPGEAIIVSATDLEHPENNILRVVATGEDSFTTNRYLTNELEARLLDTDSDAERIVPNDDIEELGDLALGAAGVNDPGAVMEREKDPFNYLRDLLPPVTRPGQETPGYDYLFGTDEEHEQAIVGLQLTRKEQEQQKYYDRFVTEENKQASQEVLTESLKSNHEIGRVLREAGIDATSMEAVNAIRENADIRYEVAKYFAQKLDDMVMKDPHGFGWRVEENRPDNLKEDPLTGKKMMSRDYVVSLALKMLGGEFSVSNEDDSFTRDPDGRVAVAQHRHATLRLLMGKSWQ